VTDRFRLKKYEVLTAGILKMVGVIFRHVPKVCGVLLKAAKILRYVADYNLKNEATLFHVVLIFRIQGLSREFIGDFGN